MKEGLYLGYNFYRLGVYNVVMSKFSFQGGGSWISYRI